MTPRWEHCCERFRTYVGAPPYLRSDLGGTLNPTHRTSRPACCPVEVHVMRMFTFEEVAS